jgi:hypothetical protein
MVGRDAWLPRHRRLDIEHRTLNLKSITVPEPRPTKLGREHTSHFSPLTSHQSHEKLRLPQLPDIPQPRGTDRKQDYRAESGGG